MNDSVETPGMNIKTASGDDALRKAHLDATIYQCQMLLNEITRVKRKYNAANIVDFFAMIPVIGIPFGIIRNVILSQADKSLDKINDLCGELMRALTLHEISCDLETREELAIIYKGIMSDSNTINISPGVYLFEACCQVKDLKKKIALIAEQLIKQSQR